MSRVNAKRDIARRLTIPDMRILELHINETTGEAEYIPIKHAGQGIYPDYPIIIQRNGLPWTLGNIYLLKKMEDTNNYEPKTWQNLSIDLLHYLRWLEDTSTNPLFFPTKQKFNRPTYKYRNYLIEQINQEKIAISTAASRISSIVNFYRGLVAYNILSNEIISLAWEEKEVLIRIIGRDLQPKLYSISSTDLAIKKTINSIDSDYIRDGGQLRPLSEPEQEIIAEHLKTTSTNYRLIFAFAILTGARLQTICTLRGQTLDEAIFDKENNRYLINVGGRGNLVDTKGGRHLTIAVPTRLFELLTQHWNSVESINTRIRSFYGNVKTNYLFLNKIGEPYVTAKNEKIDRRDPNVHRRVSIDGGVSKDVKTRNGQAIWAFINNVLIPRIRKSHPSFKSFSFHDLRATFGMNLLESLIRTVDRQNAELRAQGKEPAQRTEWILEQIQNRLGHSDLKTAMLYLNFRRNNEFKAQLQAKVEDELMQYVPSSVLEYDDE